MHVFTFIPHCSDVVEPFFDCSNTVWRVLVSPACDFGYGGHRAFESAARLRHHRVVAEVEIQRLHNVGGVVFGAWVRQKQIIKTFKFPHLVLAP